MLICIHKCIILRINPLNRIHVGKVHSCKTTDKLKLCVFYAPFKNVSRHNAAVRTGQVETIAEGQEGGVDTCFVPRPH